MDLNKIAASVFGIGLIGKGGGTLASLALCLFLYLCVLLRMSSFTWLVFFALVIMIIGIPVSTAAEKYWGKDSNKIVIDEVLGMAVGLLFLPINLKTLLIGLILFRFFDIAKPLYIKKMENFKGGWGVMMDDLLAGIYTNIVIQILIATRLLT